MRVELRNNQTVFDLTADQRNKVKKALTFDNPAYKSAKRYGGSRYISIPKTLEYYDEFSYPSCNGERKKAMTVPAGVDLYGLLNLDVDDSQNPFEDCRVTHDVEYPAFRLTLRPDQQSAEDAYLRQCECYAPKSLVQLPTGKGKSILALHLAMVLGQKTLILVHKDDLVVGWKKDIELCFPGMKVGLIKAKSRTVGDQITIATVQTLSRMSQQELNSYIDQFGLVVQDECHHIGLNIFNVIGQFNSRYKLGLSATPKRSDGLSFVFDVYLGGLCYVHQVREYDEDISQVEVRYLDAAYRYKPFYFDGQVFNYYDFKEEDLPENIQFVEEMTGDKRPRIPFLDIDKVVVNDPTTMSMVCDTILQERMYGHSCLVLFTQKEHVRAYYSYLQKHLPEGEVMCYYGDSNESSEEMMRRAESKEVYVTLATYAKATEGTNVKAWEVLFMVSSSNNEKNIEQATGRIRRRKKGKLDPVRVYVVRYPGCYSLRYHSDTYARVFKRLKYVIPFEAARQSMFSRGYR